jgi:hypothetical protein
MKKKLSTLVFILLIILMAVNAFSQSMGRSYKTALGVKFYPASISIKHFTSNKVALEGLGYFWNYGFRVTGLYEIHGNISDAPGLKWYVGPGAHIGVWNDNYKDHYGNDDEAYFGVDGVLGLDYKFNKAPINMSVDIQPHFNFGTEGHSGFEVWGGLAIRYTF